MISEVRLQRSSSPCDQKAFAMRSRTHVLPWGAQTLQSGYRALHSEQLDVRLWDSRLWEFGKGLGEGKPALERRSASRLSVKP